MQIGVVLSGGGAKGIAHLGVLQALEEEGLRPHVISGVSSGAIIGGIYSAGLKPIDILEIIIKTRLFKYYRPAFSRFGFLDFKKFSTIFLQHFPVTTFEELSINLFVSATDLREGKTVYFNKGELITPILASASLPVVFAPVEIDNKLLVDGGVINNLPVEPLIGNCDLIIGVHANPLNPNYGVGSIKTVIERTFQLAIANNIKERIKFCNVFIEPSELIHFSIFDLSKAREIFKIGYDYAKVILQNRSWEVKDEQRIKS